MNKRISNSIFSFLENLGAGVWIGAIAMFGVAVASVIFREAGSINLAGNLNGKILARLNLLETIASVLMSIAAVYFLLQSEERDTMRWVKTGLLLVMICLLVGYGKFLTERLEHLRLIEIVDFDNFDASKQIFRDEFNKLHKLYTQMTGVNLFMALGFMAISAFQKR
jgi:hypothetical protein